MSRNIRMILEYDGGRYNGWQRLGEDSTQNTIQKKLEEILGRMTGKETLVIGSGRTDAGVHAYGQTANFHTDSRMSCIDIRKYLMTYLPKDISVRSVDEVPDRFHSRLSASAKTYLYRIALSECPDVFQRKYTWLFPNPLDTELMEEAASFLTGRHDFKGFSSVKKTKKTTVREIYSITIETKEREIQIRIRGNGFLYNMVRILAGTLAEIGSGSRTPDSVLKVFETRDRNDAGITAPSQGLFLENVEYPADVLLLPGMNKCSTFHSL